MPISVKISFVILAILFVFAVDPMRRIWRGDIRAQRRLGMIWTSTHGSGMGNRWLKTIAVRFVGAGFLLLAGISYILAGGGTLGQVLAAAFGCLLLITAALTISILMFSKPQSLIPPHMRDRKANSNDREPK